MIPQNIQFGGGAADSAVNPGVLAVILLAGIAICLLSRKKAIWPFLALAILIPYDQVVVIAGVHFPMLRLLAIFGLVRVFSRKLLKNEPIFSGGMNGIDWAVIALTTFMLVDGTLLWQSQGEVVYQLGNLITVFGVYFLLRHLIQNWDDVRQTIKGMGLAATVIALFMIYEYATGRDLFYALLGGAYAQQFSTALHRAGDFRARGCFAHPILAGAFAGFVFPLFVGWWWKEKAGRKWAVLGAISAAIIPFTTGSSTALFALLGGVGALCLWPMRRNLRLIRWGVVAVLVAGQIYMTSPVWHIISDVHLSADSSSYHRYALVNECIIHFRDWFLVGTKTYASWGWDMWDLSNQYVANADTGGLIPLLALIAILVFGFKYIGRMRKRVEGDKPEERFIWAVGASLFANLVAFWGISYFDQTIVPWYALLAIISAVTLAARKQQEMPIADAVPVIGTASRPRLGPVTALWVRDRKSTKPTPARDTPGRNWMVPAGRGPGRGR